MSAVPQKILSRVGALIAAIVAVVYPFYCLIVIFPVRAIMLLCRAALACTDGGFQ